MELLTGEYRNTLDEKGRVSLPSKLRTELSGRLIVTQSFDRCLWLYTAEEWKKLSSKIMESSSPFDSKNLLVLRRFISPAQEVEIDKVGRLSIPQSLRDYAGLKKDCVILGVNKYVEIWDAEIYKNYLAENADSLSEAIEVLKEIKF